MSSDATRIETVKGDSAETGQPKFMASVKPVPKEICERIGPLLRDRGLIFVGIDVIDGNLTEINVTSPTGIRAIKRLGGPDLAVSIWDAIERRRM